MEGDLLYPLIRSTVEGDLLYLVHVELAHNYKNLNNFKQERGMDTGLVPF